MASISNLDVWQLIGLRLILAALAATLGAWAALSFKKIGHLGLCLLISWAAGALLAVALFDILPEAIEWVGPVRGILSFISGYVLFFGITRFVFHICPACSATHTEVNFKAVTVSMIAALSIHSLMDGLAIYSGYLTGSKIGILILLAVVYHKFPEGLALTLVALGSGMKKQKAFFLSFFVETITTLAGGLIGFWVLAPETTWWFGYLLGLIGGGFLFLVIHALLSEAVKHHPGYTILAAALGVASILLAGHAMAGL